MLIKHKEDPTANTHWSKGAIAVVVIVLVIAIAAGGLCLYQRFGPKPPEVCTATPVEEVPESLQAKIQEDMKTPGVYQYGAEDGQYVMLTFGQTTQFVMEVTPQCDGTSVYFDIKATEVSTNQPWYEYRLYHTNAKTVTADLHKLQYPGYGVGTVGINYGWSQQTEDGALYITPLMDTVPTDRIFKTQAGVQMGNGLYYYEYEINTTGAVVVRAVQIDTYDLYIRVGKIDAEAKTCDMLIPDGDVRVTASIVGLAKSCIEDLAAAEGRTNLIPVCIGDVDGVLTILQTNPKYIEQQEPATTPTNAPEEGAPEATGVPESDAADESEPSPTPDIQGSEEP